MRHARPRTRRQAAVTTAALAGVLAAVLVPAAFAAYGSDSTETGVRGSLAPALTAGGSFPTITAAPEALPTITAPAPAAPRRTSTSRSRAAAPFVPTSFGFTGSGWGHGVGMSQVGAFGMASEGASTARILKHYYTGTKVRALTDDVPLAVNVAHGAGAIRFSSEALAPHGGAITVHTTGLEKNTRTIGGSSDAWTATSTSSGITVRLDGEVVAKDVRQVDVTWAGTTSKLSHVKHGQHRHAATALDLSASSAAVNPGHRYRYGKVTMFWHGGGRGHVEAVNTISLHRDYLRGLGEVPSSWPAAALRAQVDAARSYALVKYGRGIQAACDCHVDDFNGPFRDQVFVGYSKEAEGDGSRWLAAVAATEVGSSRGRVVTYDGKVAQTFYFASSGGRTESSADVWGTAAPYLQSVDDHWSTDKRYNPDYATWGPTVRSESAVAAAFGLPDVTTIRFTQSRTGVVTAVATSLEGRRQSLRGVDVARRLHLTSVWIRAAAPLR